MAVSNPLPLRWKIRLQYIDGVVHATELQPEIRDGAVQHGRGGRHRRLCIRNDVRDGNDLLVVSVHDDVVADTSHVCEDSDVLCPLRMEQTPPNLSHIHLGDRNEGHSSSLRLCNP